MSQQLNSSFPTQICWLFRVKSKTKKKRRKITQAACVNKDGDDDDVFDEVMEESVNDMGETW